jgi:hypothetical protein
LSKSSIPSGSLYSEIAGGVLEARGWRLVSKKGNF